MTPFQYRKVPTVYGKSRESTTEISLEASRIKRRQSSVVKLHYLLLIMSISITLHLPQTVLTWSHPLSVARGLIQHPSLSIKTDQILSCF